MPNMLRRNNSKYLPMKSCEVLLITSKKTKLWNNRYNNFCFENGYLITWFSLKMLRNLLKNDFKTIKEKSKEE